jgi:hypothetical protein
MKGHGHRQRRLDLIAITLIATQELELTVLKGVGPFAVSLFKGAKTLGDFDAEGETLSQGMAVTEVKQEQSQQIFNQHIQQSGGFNFGQANRACLYSHPWIKATRSREYMRQA